MADKLDLDELKSQMRDQFNRRDYALTIELANKILEQDPEDYYALECRLISTYGLKQTAPEDQKEALSAPYKELALAMVKYMEGKGDFVGDSQKQYTYIVAQNNLGWEAYLYGKTREEWEDGLKHVDTGLKYDQPPFALDTKLRLLLKLERKDEAYEIVLSMLKKNENDSNIQDLKKSDGFKEWVNLKHPSDMKIVDKYAGMHSEDNQFLHELEAILNRKINRIEADETSKTGFVEENGRITKLVLYYLWNVESLPENIGSLSALKELDIIECDEIETLPESLGNLTNLESFWLEENYNIVKLPDSFGNLLNLKELTLRSITELESLPNNLGNLKKLEKLTIDYCGINSIPESVGALINLSDLTLVRCSNLEVFLKTIDNLQSLKTLKLRDLSSLKTLPEEITKLTTLEKLVLTNIRISSLPKNMNNLQSLKTLKLRDINSLETLSEESIGIRSLEELILTDIGIKTLPRSIGHMSNLKTLEVSRISGLTSLPESIGDLRSLELFKLDWCDNLQEIPASLNNLRSLKELVIHNCNNLTSFPKAYDKLENLASISFKNLSSNLKHLPRGLGDLKALRELTIETCNGLVDLPKTLGNLKSLEILEILSCKGLETLPDKLANANSLQKLTIHYSNKLIHFPKNITKLSNLRELNIEHCPSLKLRPDDFVNFKSIETIKISDSGLKETPHELSSFKQLKVLELSENIYSPDQEEKLELIEKRWLKYEPPWRSTVLWGLDEDNNPSFVILYGRHEFSGVEINITEQDIEGYTRKLNEGERVNKKPDIKMEKYKILQDDVTYNSYAVFRGKGGHFPSYQAVKVIQNRHYNYDTREYYYDPPQMFYKKDVKYYYGWKTKEKGRFKEFFNINPKQKSISSFIDPQVKNSQEVRLPYFTPQTYEERSNHVKNRLGIKGFRFANNLNEILQLPQEHEEYTNLIVEIMSSQNIYMRKKYLAELLAKNPPREVLETILSVGSSELISGLFLELARSANPMLLEPATRLLESDVAWVDESFARGVKRCARLYLNSLNPDAKTRRINWIRDTLPNMDLHLKNMNGEAIPPDKIIMGSKYYRYYENGQLRADYTYYDYKTRENIKDANHYEPGPYTDGMDFKLIEFKNTLQESEIYGLADVIGKMAYYLDAPRLSCYLKGNQKTKALNYFLKYLRRIINSYAEDKEEKFMEVMKSLLTSYELADDYGTYYEFQGSFFIGYYLYSNDHLKEYGSFLELEGRHEYKREIWDRHLGDVLDIVLNAKIEPIMKACFNILKDSPNLEELVSNVKYQQLIQLSLASYEPLAEFFSKILNEKIEKSVTFDAELMLALIGSTNEKMHESANSYFKRTNGSFSPEVVADFILLENLDLWSELFQRNMSFLRGDDYALFLKRLINNLPKMLAQNIVLSKLITDILSNSTKEMQYVSSSAISELFKGIIDALFKESEIPDWMEILLEEVLFSISYEIILQMLEETNLESLKGTSPRRRIILVLLSAIKRKDLPSNSDIIDILEVASSSSINAFLNIVARTKNALTGRFTTLLIMFESEITSLNLHAADVFNDLPEDKQKKLHSMIIDSPVHRAYSFGLKKLTTLYKDQIPREFIVQMLEHGSSEVKAFISNKIDLIIDNLGNGDKDLFMYYVYTLLLLPNKHSKSKNRIYRSLPQFALIYRDKLEEIENILLDIGGSNIIADSERALVALAKIKKEVKINAS